MRKIIIGLFVLLCITISGCSGSVSIASKPSPPPEPPRLILSNNMTRFEYYRTYILTDTKYNQEYLVILYGEAVSVTPVVKPPIKAEVNE